MTPAQEARMKRRLDFVWVWARSNTRLLNEDEVDLREVMLRAYKAGYSDGRADGAADPKGEARS